MVLLFYRSYLKKRNMVQVSARAYFRFASTKIKKITEGIFGLFRGSAFWF